MTNKDFFKILLCSYGYDRNIKIEQYYGDGGWIGYQVYAENKDGDFYEESNCEGFLFHINCILSYMRQVNANTCSNWWNISTKDLLNDDIRQSLTEKWDKRDYEIQQDILRHRPLEDWKKQNNPCPSCKINKKDHWDDIHYNCELNHNNSCAIKLSFWEEVNRRRIEIDGI